MIKGNRGWIADSKLIIRPNGITTLVLLLICKGAMALQTEMPGVAEHITNFYDDATLVRQSHAVADYQGCGGALIGPNLFITAAHCGAPDDGQSNRINITLYPGADRNAPIVDSFQCQRILDTFPDSDMLLMYCDRDGNAQTDDGLGPGDLYGYFDILDKAPAAGASVHSVWTNPIQSFAAPRQQQVIYSNGVVSRVNVANQWENPSTVTWGARPCNRFTDPGYSEIPLSFRTTIFGESGASGSITIDSLSGRLIGGPLSTAGGRSRNSLPIAHYLDFAVTMGINDVMGPPGTPCADSNTDINIPLMLSMGLGPAAQLEGGLDKDGDGVFDAQELIERRLGENSRDIYSLFFDSERQNRLWQWREHGSIDETRHVAIAGTPTGRPDTERVVLVHPDLNLPDSASMLRGSIMMRKTGIPAGYMRACLQSRAARTCGAWKRSVTNWSRHAFELRIPGPDAVLQLAHWGGGSVEVVGLTLAETRSMMNFDSRDSRHLWKKSHGRGPTLIRPDGRSVDSGTPNFALVVDRDSARSWVDDQAGRFFHAGFVAGKNYSICLEIKQDPLDPLLPAQGRGYLSLTNNKPVSEGTIASLILRPTANWTRVCSGGFTAPSDSVNMYFGVRDYNQRAGSFLVDDIEINDFQ